MSASEKMVYNIDWIIPNLRSPTKLWSIASTITVAAVGLFSKILIRNYYVSSECRVSHLFCFRVVK
jgi:hypothetical protein